MVQLNRLVHITCNTVMNSKHWKDQHFKTKPTIHVGILESLVPLFEQKKRKRNPNTSEPLPYLKLHLRVSLGGHAGSAGEMEACELTACEPIQGPAGRGRAPFSVPKLPPWARVAPALALPAGGGRGPGPALAALPRPPSCPAWRRVVPGPFMGQEASPRLPTCGGSARSNGGGPSPPTPEAPVTAGCRHRTPLTFGLAKG